MKENGKSKREWVKTAAIIFLAVMLVLTFFSNTIMNYSLPEVATQYVVSDSITARIRGTGVVESGDPYEVMVTESRKVSSVAVRVGETVEKGDVLFYLEDAESEELKAARKALEEAKKTLNTAEDGLRDARDNYYEALLTEEITASDIQASNSGTSAAAYRQKITDIQTRITEAENELKPYDEKIANLDRKIADIDAQNTYEAAQLQLAQGRLDAAKSKLGSVSGNDSGSQSAREELNKAQKEYDDINAVITNLDNLRSAYVLDKYIAERDRANAGKKLEDAKKELNDLTTMLGNMQKLDGYKDLITDAQEVVNDAQKSVNEAEAEVAKLEAKSFGATITAGISGTITSINVTAGNTTSTVTPVAVLQPEGQGYTMSFSVTNEQARRLAVGDRADLVNAWRYDDVNVVLSSIRPDKDDPSQRKLLTFDITGGVIAGQTLNISVGQQSANFDLVVPNSAIREDNNGKFILIVERRASPLGNRYVASRVDVDVLASDDTKSAISAALYGYEYVITTSTQPVEAGQLVRLANN